MRSSELGAGLGETGACALSSEAWIEFNRVRWGISPLPFERSFGDAFGLWATLYVDGHGRIVLPRLNRYFPLRYHATPAMRPSTRERRWLEVAGELADEMRRRGVRSTASFPPEVRDVRPWRWAGFRVDVSYTAYLDFPLRPVDFDPSVTKKVRQAKRSGYRVERTTDVAGVLSCIRETEERQAFGYGVRAGDLETAFAVAGHDTCRAYLCRGPDGDPASARIAIHAPGTRSIDWLAGTKRQHLGRGATQMVIGFMLEDLSSCGSIGIDFCGANIRSVAAAKMNWGARLESSFLIEEMSLRNAARWVRSRWRDAIQRRTRTKRAN